MDNPRYKLLGLSCDGITRTGTSWKLQGGERPVSCPAILYDGDYILVVGRMVSAGEVRRMGGEVQIGEQAVAVSRELLLTAAQELRQASTCM